ncbi:wings apart-like protein 1 [Hibiscus syriacus]|uniref:wings apart-like protein 1 n=1 Tax=Hibiscus syriacus TaxID=106335 RepID=UPI001922380E|nr:wings apart-like protein 1 [Hibiscus syriacus]
MPWISSISSLMEAQEFGEMMKHVDEVNFALDGLKKGHPVRVRRASLLSLLSICATAPQRRLLRTHGMAKTIIDSILGLNFDDIPSNLAAAAVFYVLTNDVLDSGKMIGSAKMCSGLYLLEVTNPPQGTTYQSDCLVFGSSDHLLESPCCIRFLIKILKPITPLLKKTKTEK